jgi:hypothetical protein
MSPPSRQVALSLRPGIVVSGIVEATRWAKNTVARVSMYSLAQLLDRSVATPRVV